MKILHINYYDIKGGAALAAYRLCKQQRTLGIDASMVVAEKFSDDPWVISLPGDMVKRMRLLQHCESALHKIAGRKKNFMPHSFNLFSIGAAAFINAVGADILHLHWINGQMLSIGELAGLRLPTVWTLHDTWPFCGTEHHHFSGDNRYIKGYRGYGLEDVVWRKKCKLWQDFFPVIVGPSTWIAREAAESMLFQKCRVEHIFNGIDLKEFSAVDKEKARQYWGMKSKNPVVVIGAASFADKNKGGKLLRDTLDLLPDVFVLALGKDVSKDMHRNILCTGEISDRKILSMAYSAGDVFLSAARYDNLPNMLIESIACGTPVAALDVGGVKEIIGKSNGITAAVSEARSLAEAVRRIIDEKICPSPSAKAFDINNSVSEYVELYQSIIKK